MTRQTFTPREYQHAIIEQGLDLPRCAIWAGMGMGKSVGTLTALDILELTEPGPAPCARCAAKLIQAGIGVPA